MKKKLLIFSFAIAFVIAGCKKNDEAVNPNHTYQMFPEKEILSIYTNWPEGFETGTKTAYAGANVTLQTGVWFLNDALIGTSASDRKVGAKSIRIQSTGTVTMTFNVSNGASVVRVQHAIFGTDGSSTWDLYASTNNGSTWTKIGNTVTTNSTTLQTATFGMNYYGSVRFEIRKLGGGRLNIDEFVIEDNSSTPTRDDNMGLGNPSNATTNTANANNYLMSKPQFTLAYNNSRGTATWVSWHLSTAWKGNATRCDCFTQDATLPSGYFRASSSHYTNTGFDRGHLCPSEDRDGSSDDNRETFRMTNIIPQAPNLNQITWLALENYCRTLINQGNELYIYSGGYGMGGTGSLGGTTNTLASGSITVPSRNWKVIVVLPVGKNDVDRINASTRVIAVDMPNIQGVQSNTWGFYRTSVDAIEANTGLDLLNILPVNLQNTLETVVDNGPTN
ncbi:MAG: DNA/RNA non-specific endonuclease [Bacteroidia bacterium]